jgi:hypothetical protein
VRESNNGGGGVGGMVQHTPIQKKGKVEEIMAKGNQNF